ncbi:MAG TPA: phospholipase D-like domain-containing protein [Polyangia bacterium]
MTTPRIPDPAAERSRLRATAASIEPELPLLPRLEANDGGKQPPGALAASRADRAGPLARGSEPEVRECPICSHIGLRAAVIRGQCWNKLALEIRGPQCARLGEMIRREPQHPVDSSLRLHLSGLGGRWRLRRRYLKAFARAWDRIDLAHGYFLPDAGIVRAITAAARRGVQVRLLLAGRSGGTIRHRLGRAHEPSASRAFPRSIRSS